MGFHFERTVCGNLLMQSVTGTEKMFIFHESAIEQMKKKSFPSDKGKKKVPLLQLSKVCDICHELAFFFSFFASSQNIIFAIFSVVLLIRKL